MHKNETPSHASHRWADGLRSVGVSWRPVRYAILLLVHTHLPSSGDRPSGRIELVICPPHVVLMLLSQVLLLIAAVLLYRAAVHRPSSGPLPAMGTV